MMYTIIAKLCRGISRLVVKGCEGLDDIPKDGNFIIAANHESPLDAMLITAVFDKALNKKVHFLASRYMFRSRWRAFFIGKALGCIPVDFRPGHTEECLAKAKEMIEKGEIVAIFPEGVKDSPALLRGKTGIVRLALASKKPVLPIGISRTYDVIPMDRIMPRRLKRIVRLRIGSLMSFERYHNKKISKKITRELTDTVMESIARLSGKDYNHI